MGNRRPSYRGLGLVLAVALIAQQAVAEDKCRSGCKGTAQNFKYAVGTQYTYDYEGKIDISLSSAEGQIITTEVKAKVLLTQLPDCNQLLKLQNVQVIYSGGKLAVPDIDKPIRINFHDGHIEDSICVEKGDNQNSINIKRAIASAFQVNLHESYETDVFGLCPTETTTSREGAVLVVNKARNLNKCAYRENIRQDFLATTFNKDSEIKSSPILSADYNAVLKIKNGILDTAQITESYLYVPFSVGKNGAKAQVTSKLRNVGTGKGASQSAASIPKSIIFDNPHPVNVAKGAQNVHNILNAVKEVAKTIDVTVSENTAKEFINLVKILKVSNKNDILTVYSQVKSGAGLPDKEGAKKIFWDAILRAGNGDAIEVAIELLKNKELSPAEQRLVFLGLSFVRHATEGSLTAALNLLNQKNLAREAYLGIGNLVGKFCKQHDCSKVDVVNKITQKLVQQLNVNKNLTPQEETEVIYALKALANINQLNDQAVGKIVQIAQNKNAPIRLRVVALETFLADPCKDKLRNAGLDILKDIQQDSEIRIKAYLAAVQCPTGKVGETIQKLLQDEPSYQVGGFIVSHIRNVKASANPDKDLAKRHLSFSVPQRFPVDFRKWSYNGEFSYAVNTLGLASSTETNIIYSQESWLPRSNSLNLTVEIFGHNVNFLEIETRQQNLDKLINHYFGPNGVLSTQGVKNLLKEDGKPVKSFLNEIQQKLEKSLRARRDLSKADVEKTNKEVKLLQTVLDKDLDLDLSVKAFGSEVLFVNFNDKIQTWSPEGLIDKIINEFNKGLDKLKNFEETVRNNLIFLDAEFDYPTSLGFPIRLAVEGSATVQVKAKGSIDVRALLNQNKETAVKLALIPSANVEVSGRLTMDALVVENGLKVVSTLHSAVGGDLDLQIFNDGQSLELKYNIPVQKQTIISANHEILAHTRLAGTAEKNNPLKFAQNKDFSICVDHLKDFIGLEFCGEYSGPNLSGKQVPVLPFPLAGDANVKVEIIREDLKQYVFRQVISNARDKFGGEIELSTIGNNGQKKASVQLVAQLTPEKFIKAEFVSPKYKALAEGRVTLNDKEKSVLGRINYVNNEFYGKIGVAVSGSPSRSVYKPIFEYKTPNSNINSLKNVEGQIVVERQGENTKYIFDQVRVGIPNANKQVLVKGSLGKEGPAFFTDLDVSDGQHSATISGRFQATSELLKFNAELKNTFNPNANVKVKGEFKRQNNRLDNFLQIVHGADLSSKKNILTISNTLSNNIKSPLDFEISTKNSITYPALGLDVKLDFEEKPKEVEYDLGIQYADVRLGSKLDLEYNQKQKGDHTLDFSLWGLDNKLAAKSDLKCRDENCNFKHSLDVNGKQFVVDGKGKYHIKPQDIDFSTDVKLSWPSRQVPVTVKTVLKYNPNEVDASQVVIDGGKEVINVFLKANKNGNANGNVKIAIKDVINVNGQLKANKGVGNGDILVELASKGQIKAEGSFTIQSPKTYNVLLTIYPVFDSDKNKKIVLSTQNSLSQSGIDSKNIIDFIGNKLQVNLKGSQTGDYKNGKQTGEVELILPNDQYFLGKLNRDVKVANDLVNGQAQISLEHRKNKNAPGQKVSLKGVAVNTNYKEGIFDLTYNLAADDSNGKNINGDLTLKRQKQGENGQFEFKNKIYGSVLKNPLETVVSANCRKGAGSYELRTTYGPAAEYSVKGKYDLVGHGRPITGDVTVELKTPNKNLKLLKLTTSGSFKKPETPSDTLELQSSWSLYADDDGSKPDAIVDVAVEGNLKVNEQQGQAHGSIKAGKKPPVTVALGYAITGNDDKGQVNANLAVQYEQNKNIKADVSLVRLAPHEYKLVAQLDTPTESHRNNKLTVHTKRSEDNKNIESQLELVSDGRQYTVDTLAVVGDVTSSLDIKRKNFEGKIAQLFIKHSKLSDTHCTGELKIVNEDKNFLLEETLEANIVSVDDFSIKLNANSPALKWDKLVIEIQNKPGKSGRRIQVNIKSANKNILSGSTSYQARDEGGKYIVDGSGTFKVKEESKSGNFKYIRQTLTQEKNGERGYEISFDAGLGNHAIDAEYKLTSKQFRIMYSLCEEKKECAHIEIDSRSSVNTAQQFNHELEIAVDLRKLGLSHEFGFKSITNRKEFEIDHTVDVHFQSKEKSKYQYSLYLHPKEAGVTITTPKRTVSLEGKSEYPKTFNKDGGKISGQVVFYLDKKNQPSKKTSLEGWVNVNVPHKILEGDVKFVHPGLQRPLSASIKTTGQGETRNGEVTITGELDVFAQPAQKLVIVYKSNSQTDLQTRGTLKSSVTVRSSGLGVDIQAVEEYVFNKDQWNTQYNSKLIYQVGNTKYDNQFNWRLSTAEVNLLLRVLNIDLLNAVNKLKISKEQQVIDSEVSSYDNNPVVSHLEVKQWNTVRFDISRRRNSNDKLALSSGLIPGQIADVRADLISSGGKKNLFHASVKLDDANFLKPDYGVDSKQIQDVVTKIRNEVTQFISGVQNVGKEWATDLKKGASQISELSKRAQPNLKPLQDYYTSELKKIREEIVSDKTIKDISDFLKSIFGTISRTVTEIFHTLSQLVESIVQTLQKRFSSVIETIQKDLIPHLQELAKKIVEAVGTILNIVADVVLSYVAKVNEIVERYQPEIKKIATAISELTQDVGRLVVKVYENARTAVSEQWKKVYNEIKALPVFEELKNQIEHISKNGIPNADSIVGLVREILNSVAEILPSNTPEVRTVFNTITNYLEKKLKNQPVDDVAELEKIATGVITVVRKVVQAITAEFSTNKLNSPDLALNLDLLTKLPRLAAIKFSPFGHILKDESKAYSEFLLSLISTPENLVAPFPLVALIGQGQSIFTFDGKQYDFPVTCNTILAHDALHHTFTLVGTYNKGVLSELHLSDGKDTVTVKKEGKAAVNNAPSELPIRKDNVAAYRDYYVVNLRSDSGVLVTCKSDLTVCLVKISGFLHGQIRGLLGNGNNDPYDDYTNIDDKITDVNQFANSYKMWSNCPTVNTLNQQPAENPTCQKLFSWESSLRYCYPFVNTDNFKRACNQGFASGLKDTEEVIAKLYVTACVTRNIYINTPDHLIKCENSEKTYQLGETFSVKLPHKAADIVLLIDTVSTNEQTYTGLVQPLVTEVLKELHGKGINDVELHLITYGGQNLWPSHVTVNGKLQFKGKPPQISFKDAPKQDKFSTDNVKLDKIVEEIADVARSLKLALGLNLAAKTYNEAIEYPFRTNAVKSIIAVTGLPCETGKLLALQKLRTLLYRNKQIKLNLITPITSLALGDVKKTNDVIGFNERNVFTLSQGKKKKEGSPELHSVLHYDDYCIDFTIKNGGNVFDSDNLKAAKGDQKKVYQTVAAHNIVEQLTNKETGLDCECKRSSPWSGQNVCSEVYSKDKPSKKPIARG